jgi:hypothetical protein
VKELQMSTPADTKYELFNGEEINLAHPDSFYIPERSIRENMQPGQYVKAVFKVDQDVVTEKGYKSFPFDADPENCNGERMWIKIEGRSDQGGYVGVLHTHPVFVDLKWGDQIIVKPEHIINIYGEEDE